jgi:lipopolysaccharide/colanic/teichoic acid biosynthesis glycosyltransferase
VLYARFIKRGCDILAAAAILILALPLFVLVWIAVRLALGAPVLYFSERAGQGGRPFLLAKN